MGKKGKGPGSEDGVVDFMEALKKRRLEQIHTLLRPAFAELRGYAHGIRLIHAHRTALGSELAAVVKELKKRQFSQRRINAIRREINAADKLFEEAVALRIPYEHAFAAYGKVIQRIATLLNTRFS